MQEVTQRLMMRKIHSLQRSLSQLTRTTTKRKALRMPTPTTLTVAVDKHMVVVSELEGPVDSMDSSLVTPSRLPFIVEPLAIVAILRPTR